MCIKLILDFVNTIAVVSASLIAIRGINSWKREIKWKRKHETAEDVLSALYEVQVGIQQIRNPASYKGEGSTRTKEEYESPHDNEIRNRAYIVFERYEREKGTFAKFQSLKYRFITIFGKDTEISFNELEGIIKEILIAAKMLAKFYWTEDFMESQTTQDILQKQAEFESKIWDTGENNLFNEKINKAIGQIEKTCLTFIIN